MSRPIRFYGYLSILLIVHLFYYEGLASFICKMSIHNSIKLVVLNFYFIEFFLEND